ncbi:sensor histidine kinase [Chitinimonas lacunae]|uniref:histidine kinase n=1 Tax=Chitinimonas lacunae TaxID=1963018 RepID=A0ABV8MNZ1_9NEIS
MRNTLLLIGSLAAILVFLLATASGNNTLFGQYYWWLVALNALMAAGLGGLVLTRVGRLRRQVAARMFGSRLAWRLTLMFALVAVLPGTLLYTLSVQFLGKSIETWFDVSVDKALERGLDLGKRALDFSLKDLRQNADFIADALADESDSGAQTRLSQLREQVHVLEASLFDARGRVIAHVGDERANPVPLVPERAVLKKVIQQFPYRALETTPNYGLSLRVLVPVNPGRIGGEVRVLQLLQPVPADLARDAELVEQVRNEYKLLALSRNGLKQSYALTLTLASLMALLAAVVLGMYLSEKLAAPLTVLAAGTRAVAQGDFSQMQPVVSRDELGILTHSFNRMTRQLAEARAQVEQKQREQEAAKAYLETVLGNLTAGVLAFDANHQLRSGNVSAEGVLHVDLERLVLLSLDQWKDEYPHLAGFAAGLAESLAQQGEWQRELDIKHDGGARMLLVRGTRLPIDGEGEGGGSVVVFDDVTDLLRAQRDAAWGEVAKRLAHEIRNPLTPIQLAAERLEFKLADKLGSADAEVLTRSTQTIVAQVGALKQMVDAFREYARQPATKLALLDLRGLIREVLVLYETAPLLLEDDGADLTILGDATLLRQVVHNLLKNAQEAVGERADGRIRVRLERNSKSIRLAVEDNGPGFDDAILQRIFEPYATTKKKGTGLGLAIVKKIVDEHHGQIAAFNMDTGGAAVRIDFPPAPAAATS